ncbi:S-adenosyl-L-methionine-dependent methyltransferase [Aspergillus karnatakaensis]|uniref:class I SAM-dependent methyltransferase n=1 Tax=Aspergillus karnatakaensis TaxID=1810916 RepID=UPI003CCE2986
MASAGNGNERFNAEAATWDTKPSVLEATQLAFNTLQPIITALSEQQKAHTETDQGTGLNVLEIGCGTGLLTLRVAPLVNEIVAIDPSEGMIEVLQKKIERNTDAVEINTNGTNGPRHKSRTNVVPICHLLEDSNSPILPHRNFNLILSHLVLHHVPDLRSFLSILLGCLAPGGQVALTDFEDFGPEAIKFHPPSKLAGVQRHGIKRTEMEHIMKGVGFINVKVRVGWTLTKPIDAWEGMEKGATGNFPFLVGEGARAL